MTRFVFVSGGVISGVGKGVTTASLGAIFKRHGYKTTLIKIDPYINYDAGTLRPTEHGEVWVTEDGGEIDQDLGNYERFLDQDIPKKNSITTGQIYHSVIERERRGEYLGKTVQFIPHILDEIKERLLDSARGYEVAVIELGGTVGDYENVPYLFAIKSLERELGRDKVAHVLVSYLPVPGHISEMKTKPTQQAIRQLGQEGISPDFVICRSKIPVDQVRKDKIGVISNIPSEHIISAPDLDSIYEMPLHLEKEGVGCNLLKRLGLESKLEANWSNWEATVGRIKQPKNRVKIAIVGKYLDSGNFSLTDSYLSVDQALVHAGAELDIGIDIEWVGSAVFEQQVEDISWIEKYDGVIIPGGFGKSGILGKVNAIRYLREKNIPYLGICYGLQLAVVEYARNVCNMHGAHTTEVDPDTEYPVIAILEHQKALLKSQQYGASMRLGSYRADLEQGSKVYDLYASRNGFELEKNPTIKERHRHRYEVNPEFVPQLADAGLTFSGYYTHPNGTKIVEFLELKDHPFFVATQAHPEFKSRLNKAHPLFFGFVKASKNRVVARSHNNGFVQPASTLKFAQI